MVVMVFYVGLNVNNHLWYIDVHKNIETWPCNWWLSIPWTLIDLSVRGTLRKSSAQMPPLAPLSMRDKKTAKRPCLDTEYVVVLVRSEE